MQSSHEFDRRRALVTAIGALGLAGALPLGSALAAELLPTPPQSLGPFYPLTLPLDHDNDLVRVKGRPGIAQGEITHIGGRVLDARGRPIREAMVEIWQCDHHGRYAHPWDTRSIPRDPNFQGYGQFRTDSTGAYHFRTIKPVAYPGRAPHIHFAIKGAGFESLTTQMYVAGEPLNEKDFILNSIADAKLRQSLIVSLDPIAKEGALAGLFDIVLVADGRFDIT